MDTQAVIIQKQNFTIPKPYTAGHVMTEGEASAMNQVYAENIRNNFAQRIKNAEEKKEPVPGQAELDAYCATYQFGVRTGGTRVVLDPIEREARNMAKAAITAALKAKSIKVADLAEGQLDKMIEEALVKHPKFREQATIVVNAKAATVENLDLG